MTALRERAEGLVAKWKLHDIYDTEEVDNARLIARIESTLQALVEELAQVAIRRRIADVDGDWDRGYNMAVADIAQAIRASRARIEVERETTYNEKTY